MAFQYHALFPTAAKAAKYRKLDIDGVRTAEFEGQEMLVIEPHVLTELTKAAITDVRLFDLYEGDGIDADKKSLAISVTLQPGEETPTDQEIEDLSGQIVAAVAKATGGTLRG